MTVGDIKVESVSSESEGSYGAPPSTKDMKNSGNKVILSESDRTKKGLESSIQY